MMKMIYIKIYKHIHKNVYKNINIIKYYNKIIKT